MKRVRISLIALLSLTLASCALTPEQKAQRAAEKAKAQQLLSIELAKQCDLETGLVMEKKFNPPVNQTEQEKVALDKQFAEKTENPMFKACHKMAWENYKAQLEVEEIKQHYQFYRPYYGSPWYFCNICW